MSSTRDEAKTPQDEQKIVEEFLYLLEKSHQFFSGLRDLPQYGNKHWQPYFEKTFKIFTRLWKFQQEHRRILENKERYGLKRWEIGEIASKIGQLYYHYYLRTSETNYLRESAVFYQAIRTRGYFSNIAQANNHVLVVKKLRYFARYIVVCLLLNYRDQVKEIVAEMRGLVEEYRATFLPADAQEWDLVLQEIKSFLTADAPIASLADAGGISYRLPVAEAPTTYKDDAPHGRYTLKEAVLIGHTTNQVKFSELTLDMFRFLQSLEREPRSATAEGCSSPTGTSGKTEAESAASNSDPHKYLMYRPGFAQFIVFLASNFKELPDDGVLLVYLSADGSPRPADLARPPSAAGGWEHGGISLLSASSPDSKPETGRPLPHCLHPEDLVPFTRKPMFIIVDSDNAAVFHRLPNVFRKPLVVLMAASERPSAARDTPAVSGNLMTMFLFSPALAFAFVTDCTSMSVDVWNQCNNLIQVAFNELRQFLIAQAHLLGDDSSFVAFLSDEFLRQYICRFIFCKAVLNRHRTYLAKPEFMPSSKPPLSQSVIESYPMRKLVADLAKLLRVKVLIT